MCLKVLGLPKILWAPSYYCLLRVKSTAQVLHLRGQPKVYYRAWHSASSGCWSTMWPNELVYTVSNKSLPLHIDRLSYFTRISYMQMKSHQIACDEQSQQSGVHPGLLLNIVYKANSPEIFCQVSTASLLKLGHVIRNMWSICLWTIFYQVHQNSVFVLNVKNAFMSLFMSPLSSLFLNDGRMCFAKFKIDKGISTFVPTSAYGRVSFVYSWENSYF